MSKKIIAFDLDGTLIDGTIYIWKSLYEAFVPDKERRKRLMSDFVAGNISYSDWFYGDLKALKENAVTKAQIMSICAKLTLMPGAIETIRELKRRRHILALISGSIDTVFYSFFPKGIFDYCLINELFFDENGHISGGRPTPYDMAEKASGLRHISNLSGISMDNTIFVGDNENDTEIAKAANFSIAFNCKSEKLASLCDVEIKEKNLTQILPYI